MTAFLNALLLTLKPNFHHPIPHTLPGPLQSTSKHAALFLTHMCKLGFFFYTLNTTNQMVKTTNNPD